MTPIQERHQLVELIEEAVRSGARKSRACSEASLSVRTLQRWQIDPDKLKEDARSKAFRPEPVNKLNAVERCKPSWMFVTRLRWQTYLRRKLFHAWLTERGVFGVRIVVLSNSQKAWTKQETGSC